MRRSALVALLAIIAVLAACSDQSATASAEASATAEATATATPTEEPTESAVASGIAGLPSFELPQSAPELAALLPDEIGGEQAFKLSMSGEEMMAAGDAGVDPEFVAFLERLDAQPEDVSFAIAASTATTAATTGAFAFRVEGADSTQLESEFQAAMAAQQEVEWAPASVGGKDVLTASDPDNPGNSFYVYTREDVIFIVTAPSEAEAAEILTELP